MHVTSVVYLQQRNVKKSKKLIKKLLLAKKIFMFFEGFAEFQWNFQEKYMITLKATKKQGLTFSLENAVLEKIAGRQIDP